MGWCCINLTYYVASYMCNACMRNDVIVMYCVVQLTLTEFFYIKITCPCMHYFNYILEGGHIFTKRSKKQED